MSAEKHTLWLHSTAAKPDQLARVRLARAVRAACQALGDQPALAMCADIVDDAINNGYAYIGRSDIARVTAARDAGQSEAGQDGRFDVDKAPKWLAARTNAKRGLSPEESVASVAKLTNIPAVSEKELLKAVGVEPDAAVAFYRQCYETGYVLLAMTNGNPIVAAAHANTLARTTGDPALFNDVVKSYVQAFPWLAAQVEKLT